ncbi:MAG: hypothetical protein LAO24_15490 [Acidobacteriia bacterium]|nr:hypothetical protein [Terriglobia bacterium]
MDDYRIEIAAALSSPEKLPRDKVLLWIQSVDDLETLAQLYRITGEGYYLIEPELGKKAECSTVQRYLLECIRQDVSDNERIQSRWEAATTFHFWLRTLLEMGDCSDVIDGAAHAITDLFLTSGQDIRDAVEQGFLEHALETAALRPYFEHWSKDNRLRETWERALEWGKAHPDFTWDLFVKHKHRGHPI